MAPVETDEEVVNTLIAEDGDSLREFIADRWRANERTYLRIAGSIAEAMHFFERISFARVVADLLFEHEVLDGVDLLEAARDRNPGCELILLTGQSTSVDVERKLQRLGATLLRKGELQPEVMDALLSGRRSIVLPRGEQPTSEFGELVIRMEKLSTNVEQLKRKMKGIQELNLVLIDDIIAEIEAIPEQERPRFLMGERVLSPKNLRDEVIGQTEIGKKIVALHHQLFKELRSR